MLMSFVLFGIVEDVMFPLTLISSLSPRSGDMPTECGAWAFPTQHTLPTSHRLRMQSRVSGDGRTGNMLKNTTFPEGVALDLGLRSHPFKVLFAAVQCLSVTIQWNDNFVMNVRYIPGLLK